MSQIEDLQARITRALDRIGQGIDGLNPDPASEDFAALRGRAEAAEQELAETREAFAASREQAEADLDAAVSAVRAEAAEEIERLQAEASARLQAEAAGADTPEVAELREALEEEQMANAQLQERLRLLKARMAEAETASAEPATTLSMVALDAELQKLRTANEDLMANNAALREANAQGVGEPELINRGMEAELEALRAARAAEAAEAGAVLDALTPLLADAAEEGRPG
ncbi:hypothetical protein [Antarctobacter sp.]|uniref:hypothetical protein n=1 Tax=Antarctobacter sp. TaxID=1872577 RepID=UPI002B26C53D|nr:hypothetical protein [Antarctobacter sp.]